MAHLGGLAALGLATLVCFHMLVVAPTDLLVGPQREGVNDVTENIYNTRIFPRLVRQHSGDWPVWNRYSLCGSPWLGNPQTALFYPPNWVFHVTSSPCALSWLFVLHHWWAGVGTYFLCRRYGLSWCSAIGAGCAFLAAPYYLANTGEGHYNPVCLMAWVPWAFLVFERVRQRQAGGVPLLATIFALCFFCGHAQEVYYLVLILSVNLLADLWTHWRQQHRAEVRALCRNWIAVGLGTAGLCALDLIPIAIYTRYATRASGLSADQVSAVSLHWGSLLQLLQPFAFGGAENYAGPGQYFWETLAHFGLVTSVLAWLGVSGSRARYPVQRLLWLWLVAMLFAFGTHGPIYRVMHHLVPGISYFRAPSRALFFASFATAVLAGFGLDVLRSAAGVIAAKRSVQRLCACVGLAALAGCAWVAMAGTGGTTVGGQELVIRKTSSRDRAVESASKGNPGIDSTAVRQPVDAGRAPVGFASLRSWKVWGLLLATAVLAWSTTWSRRSAAASVVLLVLMSLGDVSHFAAGILRTIPDEAFRRDSDLVQFLKSRRGDGRIVVRQTLLSDREAWIHELEKIQTYEPVPLLNYTFAFDALTSHRDPMVEMVGFDAIELKKYHPRLLELFGVRFAVLAGGEAPAEISGWKRVATGEVPGPARLRGGVERKLPFAVYENPRVVPRAFLVGQVQAALPGESALAQLTQLDPTQQILLPRDVLEGTERQAYQPVDVKSASAAEMQLDVDLEAAGYLCVMETYYPGWRAEVDGKPVELLQANVAFRAVPLSRGKHHVVLSYSPPGWKLALGVFAMTVVLLAGCTWRAWPAGQVAGPMTKHVAGQVAEPVAESAAESVAGQVAG